MAWVDLPRYLRRDYRRMYGSLTPVGSLEINLLLIGLDVVFLTGASAVVDGWVLRHVTKTAKIRQAIEVIGKVRAVKAEYKRRGDVVILIKKPS